MKKIVLLLILTSGRFFCSGQNVAIGIDATNRARLEVQGAVGATSAIFGGDGTGVSLQRNWPSIGYNQYYNGGSKYIGNGFAAVQYYDPNNGAMAFDIFENGNANLFCNAPKRVLTLYQSGNALIGSQYSNTSLSISRTAEVDATAYLFGTTHHSTFNFGPQQNTYIRGGKDNATVFINDIANGKTVFTGPVGINTSTPVYPLEIRQLDQNGGYKGLAIVEPTNFNYWTISITSFYTHYLDLHNPSGNGATFSASNGNLENYSDKRLKTAILPLPSVLDGMRKLRPVKYEMKDNNAAHQKTIGFIAQEVKEVFPQLVDILSGEESGHKGLKNVHAMNYRALHVIAIKAIQEQQKIIDEQDKILQSLEAEFEAVSKMVEMTTDRN